MALEAKNIPIYPTVLNGGVAVLGTDASTVGATAINIDGIAADAKVVYTAGAYGGIVESLLLSTTDSAACNVIIYKMDGATVHHVCVVNVPALSGTNGVAANVDGLNAIQGLPINSAFKKYLQLRPNMTLKVAVIAAMTANKLLIAKATGVDYIA